MNHRSTLAGRGWAKAHHVRLQKGLRHSPGKRRDIRKNRCNTSLAIRKRKFAARRSRLPSCRWTGEWLKRNNATSHRDPSLALTSTSWASLNRLTKGGLRYTATKCLASPSSALVSRRQRYIARAQRRSRLVTAGTARRQIDAGGQPCDHLEPACRDKARLLPFEVAGVRRQASNVACGWD